MRPTASAVAVTPYLATSNATDSLDAFIDRVAIRDVERRYERAPTRGDDLVGDRLRPLGTKVVHRNGGALACERPGDTRADVLSGAGHERGTSGQVEQHACLLAWLTSVSVIAGSRRGCAHAAATWPGARGSPRCDR